MATPEAPMASAPAERRHGLTIFAIWLPLAVIADLLIWMNDRRRARIPSPYAGLSDDEASPLDFDVPSGDGADVGRPPGSAD